MDWGNPSRELDAEVARKVFGWPEAHIERVYYAEAGSILAYQEEGPELPPYSTDIAAAWLVVDELVGRGMWYAIDGVRLGLPVRVTFSFGWEVEAATVAVAICRAALAACGGN